MDDNKLESDWNVLASPQEFYKQWQDLMNLYELQNFLGIEEADLAPLQMVSSSGHSSALKPLVSELVTRKPDKSISTRVNVLKEVARPVAKKNLDEKIKEIELAQKLGYFLCKCSWPPQIMVMTDSDFIYKCPSCSRIRDI